MPAGQFEHWNTGRKMMTAMNVQAVVDGNLRFQWFAAGWGGSEHDSACWRSTGMDVYLADADNTVGWNTTASFIVFDGAYRYVPSHICSLARLHGTA